MVRLRTQESRRASLYEKGTKIIGSTVRGSAIIGENCFIKNSFISPLINVGDGETIENSSTEYCITLRNTMISNVERLEESLVEFARIIRNPNKRYRRRLRIGDYSIEEI